MNRVTKCAWLAAAIAGLTAGPGCGVFDEYEDYDRQSTQYYPQGEGPPPPPQVGQPQIPSASPAGPGIYNEVDKK
jgi:hypothetical protein